MHAVARFALVSALFLAAAPAAGQGQSASREADVASADSIIAALYDVISGPAGQPRDWERFKHLFAPEARLVPAAPRSDGSAPPSLTPDAYVQRTSDAFLKNGFFERQIARRSEAFGTIVHVLSTYESRRAPADEKPFARGVNSIQLLRHDGRWWIVTVMWDQERPDNPLPGRYLVSEPPRP